MKQQRRGGGGGYERERDVPPRNDTDGIMAGVRLSSLATHSSSPAEVAASLHVTGSERSKNIATNKPCPLYPVSLRDRSALLRLLELQLLPSVTPTFRNTLLFFVNLTLS